MWLEVGALWRSHLETQHQNTQTTQSPLLLADLKSKIRQLHCLQHKVLPRHRNTYFHSNLDEYLSSATIHNLQTYIATYCPVIMASVRAAETELLLALTSINHLPISESNTLNHVQAHSALEEASHRKRNRLRILSWVVLWITRVSRRWFRVLITNLTFLSLPLRLLPTWLPDSLHGDLQWGCCAVDLPFSYTCRLDEPLLRDTHKYSLCRAPLSIDLQIRWRMWTIHET
jgi:hypothetical protein